MNEEKQNIWFKIAFWRPKHENDKDTFINLLRLLETTFKYRYIAMDEFEGAGTPGLFYHVREMISSDKIFSFKEIYSILEHVEQFDWVDFYLFKNMPQDWAREPEMTHPFLIGCSDGLVRGVDNTLIYVYTPNLDVMKLLEKTYSQLVIETESRPLKDMIVPE